MSDIELIWWLQIVRYPGLKVGPTVPFVFGACRNPVGTAPESRAAGQRELLDLLTVMHEKMPASIGINIQWCPEIEAHVLAAGSGGSLTWGDLDAGNVDALAGKLWQRYGDQITKAEYSKDGPSWRSFSDVELATIRRLQLA